MLHALSSCLMQLHEKGKGGFNPPYALVIGGGEEGGGGGVSAREMKKKKQA